MFKMDCGKHSFCFGNVRQIPGKVIEIRLRQSLLLLECLHGVNPVGLTIGLTPRVSCCVVRKQQDINHHQQMICCAYLLTLSHFPLSPFYAVGQGCHHHRVYDDVPVDWSWYLSKYHIRKSAVILNIIIGVIQRGIAFIRQFYKLSLGLGVIHLKKK